MLPNQSFDTDAQVRPCALRIASCAPVQSDGYVTAKHL